MNKCICWLKLALEMKKQSQVPYNWEFWAPLSNYENPAMFHQLLALCSYCDLDATSPNTHPSTWVDGMIFMQLSRLPQRNITLHVSNFNLNQLDPLGTWQDQGSTLHLPTAILKNETYFLSFLENHFHMIRSCNYEHTAAIATWARPAQK